MPEYQLTALTREHLPDLSRIESLCFSEPWSEQSLGLLCEEGNYGAVIVCDGRAVAYGGMTTVLDEGAVTNVATHPDHRRRGLGRAIVRALLDYAVAHDIKSVFLEVRASNLAAQELYRSEGFETCGRRKNFYRHPTEDALLFLWRCPHDPGGSDK